MDETKLGDFKVEAEYIESFYAFAPKFYFYNYQLLNKETREMDMIWKYKTKGIKIDIPADIPKIDHAKFSLDF